LKHLILVVEDQPINRELICDWLDTEGYEVAQAEDLASAFAALQSLRPNVVLLDVQLGEEDGAALATWIRQQPALRAIPVIAVTANAMTNEQNRILQAGCNACISKPINFKTLEGQLERWLAISSPHTKAVEASPHARKPRGE
jgi:two-component system, cell cycle response regulator DivK